MKKLATLFTRSLQEFKQVKTVTVCAMMGAVALVLGSLSVEIIPSVRIGFSGIPNEFVAWLFGPVVGPLFNGTMDILKYLAKPTNAYFPGLTMVTMLAGCIYGCFFYGRPMRLWRVLAAKFTVALICNVILNTFCLSILLAAASAQNSAQRDHVAHRFPDIFLSGQIHGNSGRAAAIWLKARPGKGAKKRREALKS